MGGHPSTSDIPSGRSVSATRPITCTSLPISPCLCLTKTHCLPVRCSPFIYYIVPCLSKTGKTSSTRATLSASLSLTPCATHRIPSIDLSTCWEVSQCGIRLAVDSLLARLLGQCRCPCSSVPARYPPCSSGSATCVQVHDSRLFSTAQIWEPRHRQQLFDNGAKQRNALRSTVQCTCYL